MRHDGKINRFCDRCLPLKWLLVSLLIPSLCFGQEVQIQPVKTWYICTSKPYQLTFGSSMTCPNIEQKVKAELKRYLLWSYKRDVPPVNNRRKPTRHEMLTHQAQIVDAEKQAMEAYRSFRCEWVEK